MDAARVISAAASPRISLAMPTIPRRALEPEEYQGGGYLAR